MAVIGPRKLRSTPSPSSIEPMARRNRFRTQVEALRETRQGAERNTYAFIRDILVHTFGYSTREIQIDTGIGSAGIPDVNVSYADEDEGSLERWIIVEAGMNPVSS